MKTYLLLLFLITVKFSFSQVDTFLKIPLHLEVNTDTSFVNTQSKMILNDTAFFLQDFNFKKVAVFVLGINDDQMLVENYYKGIVPDSIFRLIVAERNLDISKYKDISYDASISVMLGITNDGAFILIPDANNNNNFNDDLWYTTYTYTNNLFKINNVLFNNIQYYKENKLKEYDIPYDIKVDIDISNINNSRVTLQRRIFWGGTFTINNITRNFLIDNFTTELGFNKSNLFKIFLGNTLNIKYFQFSEKDFYNSKAIIELDDYKITFDSISPIGDYVYAHANTNKNSIFHKNYNAFTANNILNDSTVGIIGKKKYTLLDIWASWCIPCLNQHVTLKNLSTLKKFSDISILGVLIDDFKNKLTAINHLKSQAIPWLNVFVPSDYVGESEFRIFNVDIYPTYILIDNNSNRILLKTNSLDKVILVINKIVK